jgi:hypothetical protein
MKGLILSLGMFGVFMVASALTSHLLKLNRHLHMFAAVALACAAGYAVAYSLTPPDLYFLPRPWLGSVTWFDFLYGLAVLFLNCHSFVDAFFGGCTGFSTSILMALLKTEGRRITTAGMTAKFKSADGSDRIYGWRIPYLESKGHLRRDPATGRLTLTAKGRAIARAAQLAKRLMNLGAGG